MMYAVYAETLPKRQYQPKFSTNNKEIMMNLKSIELQLQSLIDSEVERRLEELSDIDYKDRYETILRWMTEQKDEHQYQIECHKGEFPAHTIGAECAKSLCMDFEDFIKYSGWESTETPE